MSQKEWLYGKGLCLPLKSPLTVTCTWGEVKETERNVDQSVLARTDLTVNNATIENSKRCFVLLKVVPLSNVADNGGIVTTYGLLDTAAVSSMITSQLAEKLKLQCTRVRPRWSKEFFLYFVWFPDSLQ